jgi:hypothetical protein
MKPTLLAPLLSAFILPGLGQIVNREVRKGALMIAAVSLLFMSLLFKVLYDLNRAFQSLPGEPFQGQAPSFSSLTRALGEQDHTGLLLLVSLLALVWVHSIWDAYRGAKKNEAVKKEKQPSP